MLSLPFAFRLEKTMGLTDTRLTVANPLDRTRSRQLNFLVDSGAIYSVVPRDILLELGIVPDGRESFSLADKTSIEREVGEAAFTYQGRTRTSPVMFGEDGDSILLGVMTLESLGLLLDPVRQEVRPMLLRV